MKNPFLSLILWISLQVALFSVPTEKNALVFMSDFFLKDGAVSEMKGVAFGIDRSLPLFDLTHEIPPYDIWAGSFRLAQTIPYWPAGTVFVGIVDPGVGTERKAVVAQLKSGQFLVGPDNGLFTLPAEEIGLHEVRVIASQWRRPSSEKSATFHGRDIFAYVGANLASGKIAFTEVGPLLNREVQKIPHQKAVLEKGRLLGTIPVLDGPYGNVWTNIGESVFQGVKAKKGDRFKVRIFEKNAERFSGEIPFVTTFEEVPLHQPLLYLNSLLQLSLALNQGDFAKTYKIGSGAEWRVEVIPITK